MTEQSTNSPSQQNAQPPQSRLMISKMILENFKSYAGAQEIGPFHKCFSSIVGPNGSGKSNVIDALLFVFGKRAKELRLNKVSELIHKSSNFPNLEYAKVSVSFQLIIDHDNSDSYDIIPNSEFIVSRTAFINNASKYTVNDRASTFTDVGILLRSHGIDLDNNRFLILQGEVEQIAMMKPKALTPHEEGLLEYLEDIIGSNRFVAKIEQAAKDLDVLNEQRTERVNRLKISEKERDNLSGSKVEAEVFMEKEKEIRRKKNLLYQILEVTEQSHLSEIKQKGEINQEKLMVAKNKLKESERSFVTMEKTYESTKIDYNKIDEELQRSTSEFGAFERRDVKLQEDMSHLKSQVKKMQINIAKESKREEECLRDADKAKLEVEINAKAVEDIRVKKEVEEGSLQEIMDGLRDSTKELRDKLEGTQAELGIAERSVSGLQTEKETVQVNINLINERVETAIKNLNQTQEKVHQTGIENKQLMSEIQEKEKEKMKLTKQVSEMKSNMEKMVSEEVELQDSLKTAISTAESSRALFATQQSKGSRSGIVTAIMKASKRDGELQSAGVIGRLGDLATIDPQYDVAISTACGSLDFIVCETLEGCETCVKYLRDHNLGRASFIALSQMDQWSQRMNTYKNNTNAPKNIPRLFDLITPKESRLLPAFYMVLKDTLVANNLDVAVKIAYVNDRAMWRVVTLDGNLIDTSGTMAGGGKETKSGAMNLATSGSGSSNTNRNNPTVKSSSTSSMNDDEISMEQIKKYDDIVNHLQSQLSTLRLQKNSIEDTMKIQLLRIKAIDLEIHKFQLSIKHNEDQIIELNQIIIQNNEKNNGNTFTENEKKDLDGFRTRISELDSEIEKSSPQLGTLRASVASLQRKILDVGGPKLSRAQAKVDILSKQYDNLNAVLSAKEVEEANCRKHATKAAAVRIKNEEDMKRTQEKLLALTHEQEEMETDAAKVNEAIEVAKVRMIDQEAALKQITAEFNALKASVEKIKGTEVDLAEEIKTSSKVLKESHQRLDHHRRNLESLRKAHVEEQKEFNLAVNDILKTKKQIPISSSSSSSSSSVVVGMNAENENGENGSSSTAASAVVHTVELVLEELPVYSLEEIEDNNKDQLTGKINLLEEERDKMKGSVNMNALMEYLRKDASYRGRLNELETITEDRNRMRREYEGFRRQRLEEFMAGFGNITLKLKEMYQMITLGGDAELELVDSLDPFSEGIVFSVRPPKKSWKNISNLSGGEKTLSSLALVFALHHYKPTPLYVMDEIDAALDFKNVSIVANYIKERTKNAQFIIISLRNNMFELADRLVGIYKTHDATKSVTINPKLFADMPVPVASQHVTAAASGGSGSSSNGSENNSGGDNNTNAGGGGGNNHHNTNQQQMMDNNGHNTSGSGRGGGSNNSSGSVLKTSTMTADTLTSTTTAGAGYMSRNSSAIAASGDESHSHESSAAVSVEPQFKQAKRIVLADTTNLGIHH